MPYGVKKQGKKYVVYKKDTGKTLESSGHFSTPEGARAQIRAILASESRRKKKSV